MDLSPGVAAPIAAARWKGLLAGFSLVLLVSTAATGTPPASGRASSASIQISVSVAPRYRLQGMEGTHATLRTATAPGSSLCIASNGAAMTLPAELVFDAVAGQGDAGTAEAAPPVPVASCDAADFAGNLEQRPQLGVGTRTVIVRPE